MEIEYKKLTEESLTKLIEELYTSEPNGDERKFVVRTYSPEAAKQFDESMKKYVKETYGG